MIPGLFKNGEESKRICIDCALSRMQEYYFPAKMHELIISLEDEFSDLYFYQRKYRYSVTILLLILTPI